jgi:hypothetical protein
VEVFAYGKSWSTFFCLFHFLLENKQGTMAEETKTRRERKRAADA